MGKLKQIWEKGLTTRNEEKRDLEYVSNFSDALQFGTLYNNSKAMNLSMLFIDVLN